MNAARSRAVGLLLGHLADRLVADPRRAHPVAGFGRIAGWLERQVHAESKTRGTAYTLALVGSVTAVGVLAERGSRRHPAAHAAVTAVATWAVLGGTSLGREGLAVKGLLDADDLPAARQRLTHLVGRDTTRLSEEDVARATIESLAENTSDAVVAPLVLGALLGTPGLVGYRAVNTLDAMVGHRTPRHEQFGWASARLDDVLNLPGSRLAALLATGLAPTVDGSAGAAWRAWRRDARHHPSPNAGPVEAAFAGALGLTLGGVNTYSGHVEDRHTLGDGPTPRAVDIHRAVVLARRVATVAVVASAVASVVAPRMSPSARVARVRR